VVKWGNVSAVLPSEDARLNCTGILWRYDFREALNCMLERSELDVVSGLALRLKGEDIEHSAWNILSWEGHWISYDHQKAALPNPRIVITGDRTEVVSGANKTIQTPYETIMRKKGICTDYAILTDALLLAMNYSPVYAMSMNLSNGVGHAVALVKIRGWYFVLDQHLPPMDLGAYYRDWESKGVRILNATLYEIRPEGAGVSVRTVGRFDGKEFLKQDYNMTENDEKNLAYEMMLKLQKRFGLKLDPSLESLSKGHLPEGYSRGWKAQTIFYGMANAYHPFFRDEFAEWMLDRTIGTESLRTHLSESDSAWIDVKAEGNDLVVTLYMGQLQ